jgi:hypothetical protein
VSIDLKTWQRGYLRRCFPMCRSRSCRCVYLVQGSAARLPYTRHCCQRRDTRSWYCADFFTINCADFFVLRYPQLVVHYFFVDFAAFTSFGLILAFWSFHFFSFRHFSTLICKKIRLNYFQLFCAGPATSLWYKGRAAINTKPTRKT